MRITGAIIVSAGLLTALSAAAQMPRAFRLLSVSNSGVTSLSPAGTLTWSNESAIGRFQVEQNFNLVTGQWFSFISGTATAAQHSLKLWDANAPTGMVYIPAGDYVRGDSYGADIRSLPVNTTWVSAVYMDRLEVTKQQWDEVRQWGSINGFTDLAVGWGGCKRMPQTNETGVITNYLPVEVGPDHPVVMITWYDMTKWCNARSLQAGLTPPYFTDTNLMTLYQTGQVDLATDMVNWQCTGYRLPTEAEWEKAARGGLIQQHYPWPSMGFVLSAVIDGTMANYFDSHDAFEQGTTPSGYYNGAQVVTNDLGDLVPVNDMANQYGLYDVAGNVSESCWDWYSFTTYQWQVHNNDLRDPKGPPLFNPAVPGRIMRGGDWLIDVLMLRSTARDFTYNVNAKIYLGFRTVRRPAEP